ncbi:MAG: energy-coupling factor ABC transporter ATP-binding protein [Clostridiales Family XIII bacterium]|jgi:cobalt/nickel transport system ATP-binding protein|nr:energy-coupling factor ABC transporter ATP-binding protein [Clostridiales Family XIII bacterium]
MLNIQNLVVEYPDKTRAIDDISFNIDSGDSCALLGLNGAGKTTLFMAVMGLIDIVSGSINVDNIELSQKTIPDMRRKVGMIFQNPDDQLFMPRIYDDIAFGPRNYGHSEEEVKEKVLSTLERLGIADLAYRSPLKLSGGEKRMAAIATVLVMNPKIIFLDEPTAFLDPRARRRLIEVLNSIPQTKLIATHDLSFAKEVTHTSIILDSGKLISIASTTDIVDEDFLL